MDGGLSMSDRVLRASGCTWKGAECGRCNYTGPAPEQVCCKACNGEFGVRDLHPRRVGSKSSPRKEVNPKETLPLFAASSPNTTEGKKAS
jgi:hypothetical protein